MIGPVDGNQINDALLVAFLDGELSSTDRAVIAGALESDAELRVRLERLESGGRPFAQAFDILLEAAPDAKLQAMFANLVSGDAAPAASPENVVPLRRPPARPMRPLWQLLAAAAVAFMLFGGGVATGVFFAPKTSTPQQEIAEQQQPAPPAPQSPAPQVAQNEPQPPAPSQPEPPAPQVAQNEPQAPTPNQPEPPAPQVAQNEPQAPAPNQPEPPAPQIAQNEPQAPAPNQPEPPAPQVAQNEPQAPAPNQPEPPAPQVAQNEPQPPAPNQPEPPAPQVAQNEPQPPAQRGWREAVAQYVSLFSGETLAGMPAEARARDENLRRVSAALGRTVSRDRLALPSLEFKGTQLLQLEGRPIAQIAYLSDTGKPIALCIVKTANPAHGAMPEQRHGLNIVHWIQGGYGYMVIGDMPPDALERISETARQRLS